MRSRGTERAVKQKRDLIEAGLSEPAGWRAQALGIVSPALGPRRPIGGRVGCCRSSEDERWPR